MQFHCDAAFQFEWSPHRLTDGRMDMDMDSRHGLSWNIANGQRLAMNGTERNGKTKRIQRQSSSTKKAKWTRIRWKMIWIGMCGLNRCSMCCWVRRRVRVRTRRKWDSQQITFCPDNSKQLNSGYKPSSGPPSRHYVKQRVRFLFVFCFLFWFKSTSRSIDSRRHRPQ
jgi:hypothetical protein